MSNNMTIWAVGAIVASINMQTIIPTDDFKGNWADYTASFFVTLGWPVVLPYAAYRSFN